MSEKKPKKTFGSIMRFIFGSYSPPGFIKAIGRFLTTGAGGKARRAAASAAGRFAVRYKPFVIGAAVLIVIGTNAFFGWRIWLSKQPQPVLIDYSWSRPSNDWENGRIDPLVITFYGSAAPAEMAGKAVTSGITITPAIPGTWAWDGDAVLRFSPGQWWAIGTRYTVTLSPALFPSHISAQQTFDFSIADFHITVSDSDFYIDPEDSRIKRALFTLRANYPIDTASLESALLLEPVMNASSGSLEKRPHQFTVSYDKTFQTAWIVSEPLGMPARAVDMRLSVRRGVASSAGGSTSASNLSASVQIPGATSFVQVQSLSHELIKTPDNKFDQVFILTTRGEISTEELMRNIRVWELPVDRPELPGLRANRNHSWSTQEMLPEVLALSRRITPEPIPAELRFNSVNSFRFTAEPGRQIFVELDRAARFWGDYFLPDSYGTIFRVRQFPREIAILSEGSLLSLTGDRRLAMYSRGVQNVEFVVNRVRPDDINHLISQSNGDLNNFRFTNYRFNEQNLSVQYTESLRIAHANERELRHFSFDFSRYLNNIPDQNLRHGLFVFTVQDRDRNANPDKRLIMVTDLGFLVKTNTDGTRAIFVQSLATGDPVSGATVSVIGLNGNVLVQAETGQDGMVTLPSLSSYQRERAPTAFVVRRGEDLSFMPFTATGRQLDWSAFDTGGVYGATDPNKVNAFIFSDRGLYRPGDEVRMAMIVKAGDWNISLARTPLECRVIDPRGNEIFNRRFPLTAEGFNEVRFSTHDWSPTGTYTFHLYLIREENGSERRIQLGSQTVKVEEFLPDTLTVTAVTDPLPAAGWIKPGQISGIVNVRNLFGTAAVGNEVKAQITLSPGYQYFRQWRDWTFRDPWLGDRNYQEFLGTRTTADDGHAQFAIDLSKFDRATYNLRFYAEAFEKGSGRNVSTETSLFVSPLDWMIGWKADGPLSFIRRDSVRMVNILAIDPDLKRTAVRDLVFSLNEMRYVSVLVRQPNGVYRYQSVRKAYPVSQTRHNIPAAGLDYRLPSAASGEFELVITGQDGLEYNRIAFSVAGTQNVERSLTRTAELEITLNRTDFAEGETIELMIKAPYEGAGLITIERDKVYAHKWFKSTGNTTMQTITVPRGLEGNGYINVAYTRSLSSPEIYMAPFSYGSVPFSISKESKTNRISLDFPGDIKPGQDLPVTWSTSRPGKIIIYAVDEGILQLAGYKTPDPLAFFFQKRALEVRTAQILDLLLPEFRIANSLAAMGGGAGYDELLGRNLNPFKRKQNQPVAFWSGIMDSGPEKRTVTWRIPDYFNGTVRVMAVAVSDQALGAADDRGLVRDSFIISPNAPMMAAPGDEFDVAVTVTNNLKGSGEDARITFEIKPSAHLSVTGESRMTLQIPEGRDQTLTVKVKAAGPLGSAELRFFASSGNERSQLASYLSVRPAVPYRVSLQTGALKTGSAEIKLDRTLYEEFATREASLSWLPMGMAKGLNFFLKTFPYGCSEQLVSAAWPFLYPEFQKEFSFTRQETEQAVNRIISILQARAKSDKSIGIWTALSESDPWITTYSAHFLTDARSKGYYVPDTFMSNTMDALRTIARSGGTSSWNLDTRAYAIYVLTLNGQVTTSFVETLKRDIAAAGRNADTGLAALYLAGTQALLKLDLEASIQLGKAVKQMARQGDWRYMDSLGYSSIYLNITARHFPRRLNEVQEELLASMADQLSGQQYTTHSANLALMAIDAYLTAAPALDSARITISEILADKSTRALAPQGERLVTTPFSRDATALALQNRERLHLFWQVTQAGFDREVPKTETKNGIEVYREYMDSSGRRITTAAVGDVVTVKLNFRSLTGSPVYDVALVDLLPAGLEPDTQSIRTGGSGSAWRPAYVDIREDRIVVFGTVDTRLGSFTYQTRAVNAGRFTVPPLFAEALYNKSLWALRPQEDFTVTGR